jgi:3-deoxy-D-manno-octulosonate 8-phosphate phosphatase (KDO 8-P phosphatase)
MSWSTAEVLASRVEAIVFDVDGVLTRGDLVYGPDGEQFKTFDVRDGHGFALARDAGLRLGLLSGRASAALRQRAADLKVDAFLDGVLRKGIAFIELCRNMRVKPEEACYVGDDLIDLPAMRKSGFPVAVADAVEEVRARAAWVTSRPGGAGAARETIEFILKAKGIWRAIVNQFAEGDA